MVLRRITALTNNIPERKICFNIVCGFRISWLGFVLFWDLICYVSGYLCADARGRCF